MNQMCEVFSARASTRASAPPYARSVTVAPAELLDIARSAALAAADLIRTKRAVGVDIAGLKSSPVDVVTEADKASEELIRALLAEARPGDGFFGEESGAGDASATGITWVVDPIDGTVNYLYDIPAYAVSIAAVEGGIDPASWTALAGVVVNPVTGEVFSATRGGGAFLARIGDAADAAPQRLAVGGGTGLATALLGTGFGYTAERRAEQAAVVARLLPLVRDIRRIGSASLDLCNVAAGRLDAYYERGLHEWDHAAGALIAAEAGARVAGFDGAAVSEAMTIAAAPALFAELEPLLIELGARA
jgi:myo-inositol-1(or 4)-monophosphatase